MTTLAQNQSFEQTAIATPISFSILDNNIRVVDGDIDVLDDER